MVFMARTQSSSAAQPLLSFIYQNGMGYLTDVDTLSYAVYDLTSVANELNPVVKVAKTAIDVEDNRLSEGRYFAPLTVSGAWSLGLYQVVWYYDIGDGEVEVKDTLIVTDQAFGPPTYYITVQDMYSAGLDPDAFTVAQLRSAIKRACEFIDRATGRHFAPVYKTLAVDGRGGPKLRLREPIIAVESVSPEDQFLDYDNLTKYSNEFTVYNRHIRLGMLAPDDRNNPKLEISHARRPNSPFGRWPDGSQDVRVIGVFGYTEPDGSPYGRTPELIQYVAKLITSMYVEPLVSDEAWAKKNAWKITEERTRDQSVRYGGLNPLVAKTPGSTGFFTGDDEIDNILLQFKAGPGMTGA